MTQSTTSHGRRTEICAQKSATEQGAAIDILTTITSTRSLATLETYSRAVWADWEARRLSDDQAQSLAEAIEARRKQVRGLDTVAARAPDVAAAAKGQGRASYFPAKRKTPMTPDRRLSMARRRRLAASGPMPPSLASLFTTGELAALRIVADEMRERRDCRLTLGEIAARAGVGVTTARNAIRYAAREGLLTIEERRRDKRPNLANVVRIVSREWTTWIARGRKPKTAAPKQTASERSSTLAASKGGGSKKMESTDKSSSRTSYRDRASRGQHSQKAPFNPLKSGLNGAH